MCRVPAGTIPAQSSRIKARATEAAQLKQVTEASSAKQVETELVSFDVEASTSSSSKKAADGSAKSDPDTDVSATGVSDPNGATATRSKMHKGRSMEGLPPGPAEESLAKGKGGKTSHLAAVAVCVAGAVMSSMLQFSFVYGEICFQRSCSKAACGSAQHFL